MQQAVRMGLLTWALMSAVAAFGQPPSVGDKAPDFTLPGSDGATHSLADYQGRYVVLAFFPKAYTSG